MTFKAMIEGYKREIKAAGARPVTSGTNDMLVAKLDDQLRKLSRGHTGRRRP